MSPDLKKCETAALRLPVADRAALAELLLASLEASDDAETERLWLEEAERRYQAYREGRIPARSAAAVMRDARARVS